MFKLHHFVLTLLCCSALLRADADETRLNEYIQQALDRNPAVEAADALHLGSLERITRAGALPDPLMGVTLFARSPETRVGPQHTSVSISQTFPWFGKLGDRVEIARLESSELEAARYAREAETVLRVKLAFYDIAYLDRALAVTREDLELLRHYETLAQARYAQGVGLQQPVIKLQADITRGLNRLTILEQQRVDAQAALNALRDEPARTEIAPIRLGRRPAVITDLDALYDTAEQHRPEAAAFATRIEREETAVRLARRQAWPDLTVGASWIYVGGRADSIGLASPPVDDGKDIFSLSIGLKLPLFREKYDAQVREAAADRSRARAHHRSLMNEIEAAVRTLAFRLESIADQLALFDDALTPQAEQALRSAESAYASGTLSMLDLLDSERTLLEVRLGRARLDADYRKALAEMERVTGIPLLEVTP